MDYEHNQDEHARLMKQLQAVGARESALLRGLIHDSPATILDVGCAAGTSGRLLKSAFPDTKLWGFERDPGAAGLAQASGLYEHVYIGGVPELAPLSMDFEMVYSRLMLRHTPSPAAAAAWMWEHVTAGGRLVLADSDDATLIFQPPQLGLEAAVDRSRRLLPHLRGNPHASTSGRILRGLLAGLGADSLRDDALTLTTNGRPDLLEMLSMPVLEWGCARVDADGRPQQNPDGSPMLDTTRHQALLAALAAWRASPDAFASWTLFYAAGVRR